MKTLSTSLLLVALAAPAMGDIFTLKDGSELDADIIEKTLEEYVLEVRVTKSIKERRTIKREDVAKVDRVSKSDVAFEETIAKLTPAPPLLTLEGYDERIKTIKAFLAEHKITTAGSKASKILGELEKERALIKAGGLKISEKKFITAEERTSDIITIESQILLQEFKTLATARSYIAAFRKYDELEGSYLGSQAQRDALPLMAKLTATYGKQLNSQLNGFDQREEKRMMSIKQLPDSDLARAMAADEAREAKFTRMWAAEEGAGERWLSTDIKSSASMKDALTKLQRESGRLSKVKEELAKIPETGKLFRDGWEAAGKKDADTLEPILDQMDAAGLAESYINQLIDRYDPTINNPVEEEAAEDESETNE